MRRTSLFAVVFALAGAGLAAAASVKTHHDPKAEFESFHCYQWKLEEGPAAPDVDAPVRSAAEAELKKHGLHRAKEGEQPDLLLAYNVGYADQLAAGFAVAIDSWGQFVVVPGGDSNVSAGLLFVLTRPKGDEPVWSGWLVQRATNENALVVLRERAPKYAKKILAEYPPD